jgi:hypothetical protein
LFILIIIIMIITISILISLTFELLWKTTEVALQVIFCYPFTIFSKFLFKLGGTALKFNAFRQLFDFRNISIWFSIFFNFWFALFFLWWLKWRNIIGKWEDRFHLFHFIDHILINCYEIHYFLSLINSRRLVRRKSDFSINNEVVIISSLLNILKFK